jgi:hypothetical protein
MVWEWQGSEAEIVSEGEDGNRGMIVQEFIDSNNEIYLTSFKQITI